MATVGAMRGYSGVMCGYRGGGRSVVKAGAMCGYSRGDVWLQWGRCVATVGMICDFRGALCG